MNTSFLYHGILVAHIIGLTLMAGTTLVDYVTFKQFWKQLAADRQKGMVLLEAMGKFPRLMGIGIGLLLLSGIGMVGITKGVFSSQLWFEIKLGLVLLIIVNGLLVGRGQVVKLHRLLADGAVAPLPGRFATLKGNIRLFHVLQLLLFVTVFVLSVFKFN